MQLEALTYAHPCRLYFDARGERDLRSPDQSSLTILARERADVNAAGRPSTLPVSKEIEQYILRPDEVEVFTNKPGHCKGVWQRFFL